MSVFAIRRFAQHRLLPMVCALLVILPPSIAYAGSFNYVSSAFFSGYQVGSTSGTNPRQFNTVWRPAGYWFYAQYDNGSEGTYRLFNQWSNPFSASSSASQAFSLGVYARCGNDSGSSLSPITCQTTSP